MRGFPCFILIYNLNKWVILFTEMEDECKEASMTQITVLIAPITQVVACHATPVFCIRNIFHFHWREKTIFVKTLNNLSKYSKTWSLYKRLKLPRYKLFFFNVKYARSLTVFFTTLNWTSVVMKTKAGSGAKCINLDGNMSMRVFKVVHTHFLCIHVCLPFGGCCCFFVSLHNFSPQLNMSLISIGVFLPNVSETCYSENKSSSHVHGAWQRET